MRVLRFPAIVLAAAACACAALGFLASSACITVPPPDLPQGPVHPPAIEHASVVPPEDQILTSLPPQFSVPVVLQDPNESFYWDVFVDYDPTNNANPIPPYYPTLQSPTPGTVDGGVVSIQFGLLQEQQTALSPSSCHVIQFLVAHAFQPQSPHTWDNVGGDIVTWFYDPPGCPMYDAGSLQDGAFPASDASDALPVTPGDSAPLDAGAGEGAPDGGSAP